MWHSSVFSRRPSSTSLLLVFLVVVLAMSLGLGYHAIATARSHRDTVEDALRDYASIAAWEYSRVTRERLDWVLGRAFDELPRRSRPTDLPSPSVVALELERTLRSLRCECRELRNPVAYFRFDLADQNTIYFPDTLPSAVMRSVVDTLTAHLGERGNGREGIVAAAIGGIAESPSLLAYSVVYNRGGPPRSVFGFITKPTAFSELFARWYSLDPLLPPSIAGAEPNDSLLHVTVYAQGDNKVFESGVEYPRTYAALDTVGTEYGGLIVEASVRPDAASDLVIGGLPRSRLPIIVGLFLVTLGVGLAALFQIRREHQLARLRDDFVSGVSHELRTPLAQIRMFAELLNDGKLRTESERKRSMNVINREARRLTHLVENVLQYSRLERVPGPMTAEATNIATAVAEAIDVIRPLAESRDVQIREEIKGSPVAAIDRDSVKQILLNLLDNALKYGPDGQVITIGSAQIGDHIVLSVLDQGPGISTTDRARIWEPYYRVESGANGGTSGTGIGLAVVERLASMHDGKAWVEQTEEAGARFVVQLPKAVVTPEQARHEE